jgi:16S rRNA (cytosine1402-N4)-methyltransferase
MNNHISVLLKEILELSGELTNKTVFDGTFGGGGHTTGFLKHGASLFSSDLDLDTTKAFRERLTVEYPKTFHFLHGNFSDSVNEFENNFFDIMLCDLGYSSNQLEDSKRGFSYQNLDEVLDLRYDPTKGQSASDLILECNDPREISNIIYKHSGEGFSSRIGAEIVLAKKKLKVITVGDMVNIVKSVLPVSFERKLNSILSRVWQALRIEVNEEFGHLDSFISSAIKKLKPGGKLMIICFHSLEDKLVAKTFRKLAEPIVIDDFGNKVQHFELLTKKAILPTEQEVKENIRSRSAMLRVLKKL